MYGTKYVICLMSIAVATLVGFVGCAKNVRAEGGIIVLSREKAVEIANKKIAEIGYDLEDLVVVVDEGNQEWTRYAEGMKRSHLGPAVLKDFEEKEAKLRGHSFWHIVYKLKPSQ